jgi:hypothetical protein
MGTRATYTSAIGRHAALFIVVPDFVKVIFVQLTHETGKVAVLEVLGQDVLCKLLVLLIVQSAKPRRLKPVGMRTSRTTKLSPSLPHRTTLSSCGLSNILSRAN